MKNGVHDLFLCNLTLIDFLIIDIGVTLIFVQLYVLIFRVMLFRKNRKKELYIQKIGIGLGFLSRIIEILPIMGLLGTLWGLMNALVLLTEIENPGVKEVAASIAPALSTTFFGLFFAGINLMVYNFVITYFEEVIERIKLFEEAHPKNTKADRVTVID